MTELVGREVRMDDAAIPGPVMPSSNSGVLAGTVREVAALEEDERRKERAQDRVADRVTAATGSMTFVGINIAWFAAWILLNLPQMPTQFDPFPFSLLTLVVSLEAIVLAVLVLISEQAQSRRADRRARIELEINLLAEREITKLVALVAEVHEHLGLQPRASEEVREMEAPTRLQDVAASVDAATPEQGDVSASQDTSRGATPHAI